jgi:hypothetical protein
VKKETDPVSKLMCLRETKWMDDVHNDGHFIVTHQRQKYLDVTPVPKFNVVTFVHRV